MKKILLIILLSLACITNSFSNEIIYKKCIQGRDGTLMDDRKNKEGIRIFDKLFDGKNPPEEIIVIARFNELNILISKIFKIIKIAKVNNEYKRNILDDTFKVSALLKDIKLVNDFLKL